MVAIPLSSDDDICGSSKLYVVDILPLILHCLLLSWLNEYSNDVVAGTETSPPLSMMHISQRYVTVDNRLSRDPHGHGAHIRISLTNKGALQL